MVKLSDIEIKLLRILFNSSKGLDSYTFFKRAQLSFSEFTKVLFSLIEHGFVIEKKDEFYVLSIKGEQEALTQTLKRTNKEWRQVPKRFVGSKIQPNEFYIPSVSLLDKKTFKI